MSATSVDSTIAILLFLISDSCEDMHWSHEMCVDTVSRTLSCWCSLLDSLTVWHCNTMLTGSHCPSTYQTYLPRVDIGRRYVEQSSEFKSALESVTSFGGQRCVEPLVCISGFFEYTDFWNDKFLNYIPIFSPRLLSYAFYLNGFWHSVFLSPMDAFQPFCSVNLDGERPPDASAHIVTIRWRLLNTIFVSVLS